MAAGEFPVYVSGGYQSSTQDWYRAQNAPDSELQLTEGQKEVARKLDIDEKEYARGVLAGRYGDETQQKRGRQLGSEIAGILQELGSAYNFVKFVLLEAQKNRWIVEVQISKETYRIAVARELADGVIDSQTVQDRGALRKLVLESIGKSDPPGHL